MNGLWKSITENVVFVLEFLAVVAAMFVIAWLIEKLSQKRRGKKEKILDARSLAMIGMFSAVAMILFLFEFPLPFAPGFYEVDFSELPVLIGTFAFGPVAGVLIEFCKIVLKLVVKGTSTAFVGDLANFVVGCSLLLPASFVYEWKKTKAGAAIALTVGSLSMTIFGSFFNAVYLLPTFAKMFEMPVEGLIAMGTAINPAITDLTTFVFFAVAPLNLLKSGAVSLLTMFVYKPLRVIMKSRK